MKPRVPIEVWLPPPDPIDGLLGEASPAVTGPAPRAASSLPRLRPAAKTEGRVALRQDDRPTKGRQGENDVRRIHVTFYLEEEDLDRLREAQRRREREVRRPQRGVTDGSAIVRDLIRKHLPSPGRR